VIWVVQKHSGTPLLRHLDIFKDETCKEMQKDYETILQESMCVPLQRNCI